MGWDGNLGRERLKLKSHRHLGKNGTFRKETCLQEDVTEAVLLWERNWKACQKQILKGITCHAQALGPYPASASLQNFL